ncbi:MAG: endonuclease MutS2 [Thermostichales cyanobacterium DRC_bins_46]
MSAFGDGICQETLELLEWPRLCQHLSTFAATAAGSRACLGLVPWRTQGEAEQLLQETAEAIELETLGRSPLPWSQVHAIGESVQRAQVGGILTPPELWQIAQTLGAARSMRRILEGMPALKSLAALLADIRTYPEVEQGIYACIDEQGEVRDSASPTLASLRQRWREQRSQIYSQLQRLMAERSGAIQEPVITQRQDRYVIPVKASHRDQIPGLIHDTSSSGATLFVEPYSVAEANNQLRSLRRQIEREIERLCQQLSQRIQEIVPDLEVVVAALLKLDLAVTRARYSLWLGGQRPRFDREAGLNLRGCLHPLLRWQGNRDLTPIDFQPGSQVRVVVITGPNTGGKTVALKTLGLLSCMAKTGLFLPGRDPVVLPWFDWVLADIGDDQSLTQNLSTFSGHIRRIQQIIEQATPDSLILLDEVGAGTDPTEGAALAAAILRYCAQHSRLTLATTHYGELKALKYQFPGFENASVEFDPETLAPLYRLQWGIPGRSHALVIAQRLGLQPEILALARLPQEQQRDLDQLIQGLEEQRRQLEQRLRQAERLQQELEHLQEQMQQRYLALQTKERHLQHQQHQLLQQSLQQARQEIAQVIRRLQQGPATPQQVQAAQTSLAAIQERYLPPEPATEFVPEVGDRVRIPAWGHTGEVLEYRGEDQVVVRSGQLKLTLPLSQLAPLDERQAQLRRRPKPVPPPPLPTPDNTYDLRGKTVADAIALLEPILGTAQGYLWIQHGIGSGRLRAGLHEWLATHPRVTSFRSGTPQEGGEGLTLVYLP